MPVAQPRFVNLNPSRTYVTGPDGQQVIVAPFDDFLHERQRKADAIYVLEGEWWGRYVGDKGPLFPFPAPREYGVAAFPPVSGAQRRVCAVPGEGGDRHSSVGGDGGAIRAQARMGRYRAAGDVLTPGGKIRATDPLTGKDVLLDDTPENRHAVHSRVAAERGGGPVEPENEDPNAPLKRSIIDTLEDMGVESHRQFAELSDETLLRIPGVNAHNLPHLRRNIGDLLKRLDAQARVEFEKVAEGEESDADGATYPTADYKLRVKRGDPTPEHETTQTDQRPSEDQEPDESVSSGRRAVKRRGSKKKATKRSTKKRTAKKASRRKPATDE